ncbi:hypothetical protein [Sediminicola luteus]|nr:hypothetical protein [Sediminicola luteus]
MEKLPNNKLSKRWQRSVLGLCLMYLLGLFNPLVLEVLHQVSHYASSEDHSHGFFSDHSEIDYSAIESMAVHSHMTLDEFKDLLILNDTEDKDVEDSPSFKFQKHYSKRNPYTLFNGYMTDSKKQWFYCAPLAKGYAQLCLRPPKNG